MKYSKFMISTASLMIVILLLTACSKEDSKPPVAPVPIEDIVNAPEQIIIDDTEILMTSYLWRDFMPTVPDNFDGQKLAAIVEMETADQSDFPEGMIIDKLWVVNKNEVWETTFTESGQSNSTYQIIKTARGGPGWDIGSEVAVVVQIIDNDQIYYLKETGVEIYRTD